MGEKKQKAFATDTLRAQHVGVPFWETENTEENQEAHVDFNAHPF
jgi:hypothetical protein